MKSLLWQLLQKRKWRSPLYSSPLTVVEGKEKTARGAQRGDEVAPASYVLQAFVEESWLQSSTDQWQVKVFLIWNALHVVGWVKMESGRGVGAEEEIEGVWGMENDSSRKDKVKRSASGFKTDSRLLVEIQKKVNSEILALTKIHIYIQDKTAQF